MALTEEEVYELTRQYDECNGGLILVNGEELQNADEYYVDKDEVIHMINNNFSEKDSILAFNEDYLEIYNKKDGYYFNGYYDIDESKVIYVICPLKADDEYKEWFRDIINFILRKDRTIYYTNLIMICHDEYAQTYDLLNLQKMKEGATFYECTEDHCNYEFYKDNDINQLTKKIIKSWDSVKARIEDIVERRAFGYAYYIDRFTLIIKEK